MSSCCNIALWNMFRVGLMNKFRSCYIKCAKNFLGFFIVSLMLLLTEHYRYSHNVSGNALVKSLLVVCMYVHFLS